MPPRQGELVTEVLPFDGGRPVTVYVPSVPAEAIVFAGDGQFVPTLSEELERSGAPSTMIVGVHGRADEALRLHEYSPGLDLDCFAAHERFFVDGVRNWTRARFGVDLPANRTAVCGFSAGGGEVVLAERAGAHGDPFWQEEFPTMVRWAFGR